MPESFSRTLYDYRTELNWVRHIGWSDDDLRQVPVHEEATAGEPQLNLANWGGTALGVSANASGGGTSANVHAIRNLYVYKREVPERLWNQLEDLMRRGGPSGYETGQFGERGEADSFPPQ